MDPNKRLRLVDIGYTVQNACVLCMFSEFPSDDWGTCKKYVYAHEKHTESSRQLSIHKAGWCEEFTLDNKRKNQLGGFAEMLESLRSSS